MTSVLSTTRWAGFTAADLAIVRRALRRENTEDFTQSDEALERRMREQDLAFEIERHLEAL